MFSKQLKTSFIKNNTVLFFLIFLIAFSIRLIYLEQIKSNPFFVPRSMDPLFYHNWAMDIARGITEKIPFKGLPFYAYFLGLIYKLFGTDVYIARLIQIVIASLSCGLIFVLGSTFFDKKVGFLAGMMAVFYKPFIFYDAMIIGTSLTVFMYLLSLWAVTNFSESISIRNALIAGVAIGLSALCRPSILLFPVALIIFYPRKNLKINKNKFIKYAMFIFVPITIILSIVSFRNYLVSGDFVLMSSHGGLNFYIGNNIEANGKFHAPPGIGRQNDKMIENAHRIAEKSMGRRLKPSESSKFWSNKAYQFIFNNPLRYFSLICKKIYLFLQGGEIADFRNMKFFERFSSLLKTPLVSFYFIVAWSVIGIFLSYFLTNNVVVLRCFLFANMFGIILYFVNSRYRLPMVPVLLIFASYAFFRLVDGFKNRRFLLLFIGSLSFLYLVLGIKMEKPHLADDYNEMASWYVTEKKDYGKAFALFKQAHQIDPNNQYVVFNMAKAYFEQNYYDQAVKYFNKSIALDPRDAESYNLLGIVYSKKGELLESIHYFKKAVDIKPNYYMALNNLATNHKILGNTEKAVKFWRYSLRINPNQKKIKAELMGIKNSL